jgi:hypothetical protein
MLTAGIVQSALSLITMVLSFILKIAWNTIVKMQLKNKELEDKIHELEESNQKQDVRMSVLEERVENLKERVQDDKS